VIVNLADMPRRGHKPQAKGKNPSPLHQGAISSFAIPAGPNRMPYGGEFEGKNGKRFSLRLQATPASRGRARIGVKTPLPSGPRGARGAAAAASPDAACGRPTEFSPVRPYELRIAISEHNCIIIAEHHNDASTMPPAAARR
jgi:hypothetical protein